MPALAIASRLRARRPDLEPVLVGAERGIEATLLPGRDFRFHLLPVDPLYRHQWWKNLRWPLTAARLSRRLGVIFSAEHPVGVLGTGGYASAPSVWFAGRRGIPTAIQEQNAFPGLATRLFSRRVNHVYLGLPEARNRLHFGRDTAVFDTGNPIPSPDPSRRAGALARFGLEGAEAHSRAVVLVTGGSQGSLAINEAMAGWLDTGSAGEARITVLWATGRGSYARYAHYHRPPAVQVFDFLDPIADGYSVADLAVGRAGMMTGAELCAWGIPSVLIPLPSAAGDHQRHNAEALAAAGASVMLPQRDLSPLRLGEVIGGLLSDRKRLRRMAELARSRGKPAAADEIVSHFLALLGV
jgi:UDP-N-acetylglucosamine--N-acetylmuramyl-(pentapeptide) pyrophosphoryl-undecaprenol N-acetylglucosamine transferase